MNRLRIDINAKWMLAAAISLFAFVEVVAQENSKNNYTGSWASNSSWVDNTAPEIVNIPTPDRNFNIYGYLTSGSSASPNNISFKNTGGNYAFSIYDTLVVFGNVTFANQSMDLNLGPGALFIIFGNLTLNNKIDISSTGSIVVTGTFTKSGSENQGSYNGGGNIYAGGFSIPGSWVPPADQKNTGSDLQNDLPGVYDFVQNNGNTPLPIELLFLKGASQDRSVLLKWATASEENFDKFIVERSADGIHFNPAGEVDGAGKNTKTRQDYSFEDSAPFPSRTYYRLKNLDLDGKAEYSKIIKVDVVNTQSMSVYPNPVVNQTLTVEINFEPMAHDKIQILDGTGAIIAEYPVTTLISTIQFDSQLKNGMYMLRYKGSNNEKAIRLVVNN